MKPPVSRYVSRPNTDEPRDTESWALTEAARRLIDASRDPENHEALQNALTLNQRLWTIFQGAISEPDCPLPRELRENLAALSILVDRQTMARLVDLDSTKLDTLVEINRAVASGLAMKPSVPTMPPSTTSSPRREETSAPGRPLRISI
jgi:flagellar protein FlaF